MVKEGKKGDSTYRTQRKAFPINIKKEFRKLIFHSLAYKTAKFLPLVIIFDQSHSSPNWSKPSWCIKGF